MPKLLAGFLVVFLLALPLHTSAYQILPFPSLQQVKLPSHAESIKPLWSGDRAICTTWSVNKLKGLWMTAGHCVVFDAYVEDQWVKLPMEDLHILDQGATVVKLNLLNDLAMLQANVHEEGFKLGNYPDIGDEVTVYGFPGGWLSPVVTWLRVSNPFIVFEEKGRPWMLLDGSVWPGHSGSPVIDRKGKVIGVVQAHGLDRFAGSTFTSSWSVFRAFVADAWQ